ncbi:MAG: hypothetical protein HW389_2570 [Bacteroidetes bacterium]|nr:hypothetical protein [Bacteroidota bacterium]
MRVSDRKMTSIRKSLAMAILAILSCVGRTVGQSGPRPSTGMKPLTELAAETYKGFPGGLYPGALNVRPRVHDSAGQALARQINPLSQTGLVDQANGKIVLLSIGMSNTTQEFSAFRSVAQNDPARNPRLTLVDGAQGGQTAAVISNGTANFWTVVEQRLVSAGVTTQQVQVVWLKEADAGPTQGFPTYATTLQRELETIARLLKSKYPNLTMTYVSSRIYGGYATTTLNPEPYAYESGFSVKWLIEKQIVGDTSLSYGGLNPLSPWLAWGPYLWSDGMIPRADGLVWESADFQADGTHPSSTGQAKVANLLLNFFKSDPTAAPWFLKPSATAIGKESQNSPHGFSLYQNYPNPFNPTTNFEFRISNFGFVSLKVFDVLGREVALLVQEQKEAGYYVVQWNASGLPSGIYLCRLSVVPSARRDLVPTEGRNGQAGDNVAMRKLILTK